MEVHHVLHMVGGEGETSYANNSKLQRAALTVAKPIIKDTVRDMYTTISPGCLRVADLGCSSGPNTLLAISQVLDAVHETSRQMNRGSPEFLVFLNDLPGNDFNTIFKSFPAFYERLRNEKGDDFGPCFVAGIPGSFYGRLFPSKTLHFVHSSYSLHWLSQIPKGLVNEAGVQLNKGAIYIESKSPPCVVKAYTEQYKSDFTLFLRSRSEEIIPGGRMVLVTLGDVPSSNPSGRRRYVSWELLGNTLNDMVSEGLIEETKLESFNIPFHTPFAGEMRDIVEEEGSFEIDRLETFELGKDEAGISPNKLAGGETMTKFMRSVAEPMLASHFGEAILEQVYNRFMEKAVEYLADQEPKYVNLLISLTRKG